ncbi:MAG: rhombosortase [Candidatus Omnitrophica bacterium]|nr:rhombosortase [Candidatus Omnitrophota bacterium]
MFINKIQNLQCQGTHRVPWLTLGLTGLMIVLYLMTPFVFDELLFNRDAVIRGELWRFLTGHFVHCSFEHLFWDLAAFVILGTAVELNDRHALIPSLAWSCLAVSVWLLWGEGKWTTYCGLSGALNGLLVVAAMMLWRQTRQNMYVVVIFATVAKIIFEFTTHKTIFTSLSSQAVPSAHAAGVVIGALYVFKTEIRNFILDRFIVRKKAIMRQI